MFTFLAFVGTPKMSTVFSPPLTSGFRAASNLFTPYLRTVTVKYGIVYLVIKSQNLVNNALVVGCYNYVLYCSAVNQLNNIPNKVSFVCRFVYKVSIYPMWM